MTNQPSDQSSHGYAMVQPATRDYPQPTAIDAALKLLVKGFHDNPMERRLLEGTVKLSQRRLPRLELLNDADSKSADAVMIDARDPQSMQWAADQPWLAHKSVIWVDAQTVRNGHTAVRRPVQWPNLPMLLARALQQGPQKVVDAQHAGDLPNKTARGAFTAPAAVAPVAPAVRPVLVVDDSLAVRAYLRSLLESRGFAVTVADCAEAGMAAAAAAAHDCILMDVLMPGMNGYEACRSIKSRSRSGSAPAIVMLTSKSSPFDHIRGKMAGCDAYLTKPVNPVQLHEVLLRYVAAPVQKTLAPPHPPFNSSQWLIV